MASLSSLSLSFSLFFLSLSLLPSSLSLSCNSLTFSSNKTFQTCESLPTLDAVLHWTYDSPKSELSMAFTAPPPNPDGWVSWGLNPSGSGMAGTQALIAFKQNGSVSVGTYDIQSYHAVVKGPISYNVSDASAEVAGGRISIFATWALPKAGPTANQVWQVGPVVGGMPGKHAFQPANLGSTGKLSLAGGKVVSPAGSPAESPAVAGGETAGTAASSPAPAAGKNGAGEGMIVSGVSVGLGLLLGFGALAL